jgi:hypothetical protein
MPLVFSPKTTTFAPLLRFSASPLLFTYMDAPVSRPTFLTILCFLTFMSSVSNLWTHAEGFWNPGLVADQLKEKFEVLYKRLDDVQRTDEESKAIDQIFSPVIEDTTAASMKKLSLIMIIFQSMTLYAAYLMWHLEKRGFYLYLIAVALAFVMPLISITGVLGLIMALSGTFPSFFMCIFYRLNLKHLH